MKRKAIAAALLLWGIAAGTAGAVGNIADVTVHDRAENRTLPGVPAPGPLLRRRQARQRVPDPRAQSHRRRTFSPWSRSTASTPCRGETANWSQTGYVLAPGQGYDIKGWRKSLQRMAAFFFTEHQNSYAARTGRPDNVGVIGVAVFRRKARAGARIEQFAAARALRRRARRAASCGRGLDGRVRRSGSATRRARRRALPARQAPPRRRRNPPRSAPATAAAKPRASPTRSSSARPRTPRRSSRSTTTRTRIWSRWA